MDVRRQSCVFFDLDSVLYMPESFLAGALRLAVRAMVAHGLRADVDAAMERLTVIRSKDSNARDHFDRLCLHFNAVADPVIIAAGVEKYWDYKAGGMTASMHAQKVLATLGRRHQLAIVSNGHPVKQAGKIVRIGLAHFFARANARVGELAYNLFATDDLERQKPAPHLWEEAQRLCGFSFARSIMVGDRCGTDILGANLLGMTTVRIRQGAHRDETIAQAFASSSPWQSRLFDPGPKDVVVLAMLAPDYEISDLEELPSIVDNILGCE